MKQGYKLILLAVLLLLAGCATATDLHVKADNIIGASDDLDEDKPETIIYDNGLPPKN